MLDEAVRNDPDGDVKGEAAVAAKTILPVVNLVRLQCGGRWKPTEEVRTQVANVDRPRVIQMLRPLQEELADWANIGKAP